MREIYTEKEAGNKVCPMINDYCIGSGCMMWEWYTREIVPTTAVHWRLPGVPEFVKTDKGFCKL